MNFKEYLQFRADESCEIGVIAHDLLEDELIPWKLGDDMLLTLLENSFGGKSVSGNWSELKNNYLNQRN